MLFLHDPVINLRSPLLINKRGVPDVSGDADPNTGYVIYLGGQNVVIGGTSAVAPLWSGLTALINSKLGKSVGFLNPILYGSKKDVCRDITRREAMVHILRRWGGIVAVVGEVPTGKQC